MTFALHHPGSPQLLLDMAVFSALACLLFVLGLPVAWTEMPLVLLALYFKWSERALRARICLQDNLLRVQGSFGWQVNVQDIVLAESRITSLEQEPALQPDRWQAGLPMFSFQQGRCRLKGGKQAFVALTDAKQVVCLVLTTGTCLLLSPSHPQDFLNTLATAQKESTKKHLQPMLEVQANTPGLTGRLASWWRF